ncbi:MAG: hypothetical protein GXP53_06700 [Deltaproteobacteria bacterium]|nr:hypothetical protein [Deltaproteobacteria bacterium]
MQVKSLSYYVSIWTGIVIAFSMAVYAVFQYVMLPDATVWSLFLNHLWHVLVLGIFIYALCWLVFQKLLLVPIRAISIHLYGVGTGRLRELELNTDISELRMIADGINRMIRRMKQGQDPRVLENIEERMISLRKIVKGLPPADKDKGALMLDEISGLEQSLLSLVREDYKE